ncbi:diguanylate cyclase [Saccharospirillum impatiens]|uniref:diguanylate cyclase n=1 Tax=Saccharospirillum impatiens TaxID=169438 RepID=UPI00041452FD|nr:diguanylate cyclase [Saccharospirillum impatiens]
MASKEVTAKLDALRLQFQQRLPAEYDSLTELWDRWVRLGQESERHSLLRQIHTLKGNSGTFGFHDLSQRAARLEATLDARQHNQLSATDCFAELQAELQATLTPDTARDRGTTAAKASVAAPMPATPYPAMSVPVKRPQLAYVTESEATTDQALLNNLMVQGYEVIQASLSSQAAQLPEWVLLDLAESQGSVRRFLAPIHRWLRQGFEVIVLIDELDFQAQLALVRAGVTHCLMRPVSVDQLLRLIKPGMGHAPEFQGRVLLMDDQEQVMRYYQTLLEASGLKVQTESEPARIFRQIEQFNPDILLLDINMPKATGPEVARVLRLHERFETLPILFLTGDHDQATQRSDLLNIGSDDLLYKGMDETELVQLITARAERARQLSDLVNRDALSGLNNHGAVQLASEQAFARAQRKHMPSSLVMLDLDNFKAVNDTYGHDSGDQVIRTLSQLLLARFRGTDTVGRYGGEEFVILLPGTAPDTAKQLTEELLADMSAMTFATSAGSFRVTFSAGISDAQGHSSHLAQFKAADEALYQAKHTGRNQVVISPPPPETDPTADAPDQPA